VNVPNPKMYKDWRDWAMKLVSVLQGANTQPTLESFAKAALPSAGGEPYLIIVTDEVGGFVPAFNDGTNWRRVTDRAVVA
jgi:hypothetical protein